MTPDLVRAQPISPSSSCNQGLGLGLKLMSGLLAPSALVASSLMHSHRAAAQVINTSLLSDAQHIEQMNRQFHPSQRGQSVPEPTPDADGLSHVHSGSGSLSAGDPLTGTPLKTEVSCHCQLASVLQ